MEEMRVYIANLGKYNEGELVGAWFTPPVDYDEMAERIGLNGNYEEAKDWEDAIIMSCRSLWTNIRRLKKSTGCAL